MEVQLKDVLNVVLGYHANKIKQALTHVSGAESRLHAQAAREIMYALLDEFEAGKDTEKELHKILNSQFGKVAF